MNSQTKILTSGNWDGDAYRDLCVATTIIGDTTHGNLNGYPNARIVVFWGQPDGVYTLSDTTRLVIVDDLWSYALTAYSADFDHSGIESLLIRGAGTIVQGKSVRTAGVHIFHGMSNGRWGRNSRNSIDRRPAWSWWKYTINFGILDQDGDGNLDFVEYEDQTGIGVFGTVSVSYGKAGRYFDTNDVETIHLDSVHGHISKFADITGDASPVAPELLVNTGEDNTCLIYAGKRG